MLPTIETLQSTPTIDSQDPRVVEFASQICGGLSNSIDVAKALYLAVRDEIRYDPYKVDLSEVGMKASTALTQGFGWCVTKSALLAAACRSRGIPARVGFADVRNHLSTERLRSVIDTNDYVWHGYTSIFLRGRWCKATPAFNRSLCSKLGVEPLEFDGRNDSLHQEFDTQGRRHLEYIRQRGEFDDVPVAEIRAAFLHHYPRLVQLGQADFEHDVAKETPLR